MGLSPAQLQGTDPHRKRTGFKGGVGNGQPRDQTSEEPKRLAVSSDLTTPTPSDRLGPPALALAEAVSG